MLTLCAYTRRSARQCAVFVLVSLIVALGQGHAFSAESDLVEVQILAINDLHGHIAQTESLRGRPVGGAAYLASYMLEHEIEAQGTIRVHAGDAVGASPPISGLLQDEPTIEILSLLGFDVGVPGNHEFDEGLAELYRLQYGGCHDVTGYFHGSSFPLVLANVNRKDSGDPIFPPYVVKTVRGVPLAFIGIITTKTPAIVSTFHVRDLEFTDPVDAVNRYIEEIREQGIETIVVLAHEGGTYDKVSGSVEGRIVDIAHGVDDSVDVIVSGHTHQGYVVRIDGKLVVQAYSKGTAFADIDLTINAETGDVVDSVGRIVTVWADTKQPDRRVSELIERYKEEAKSLTD